MSGPKVVRVVTREETLAICNGHLRRLEQAFAAWMREGRRAGELRDEEIAAARTRQRVLAGLLEQEAFPELQTKVPEEIAFLQADLEHRQHAATERALEARQRQRRSRDAAGALLRRLAGKEIVPPGGLREPLEQIARGKILDDADVLLARGFALLTPAAPSRQLDAAQRRLADSLRDDAPPQDFAAWKAAQANEEDPRLARLDRQIAGAQIHLDAGETAGFMQRLGGIERQQDEARRNLLLDSLTLDLAQAVGKARARRAALDELRLGAADLRGHDCEEARRLLERIPAEDAETSLEHITALGKECQDLLARLAQLRQEQAAQARRDAVLQGLARLRYDVREGMETAWARQGRIVLKKPMLPGYGVEIGGQPQASRIQVRAVALSANRDPARDSDVETLWCGEFSRLQALLAGHGDSLLIERALGVGETPLKVVEEEEREKIEAAQRRTME
jgi:hypothetical protein